MKRKLFSLLIIFISALFWNFLFGQTEGNDAVYHKIVKEYILHEDGRYDLHVHKEVKILTHYAFHRRHGETFIIYNPDYQKVKVNESYTIMADGKRVETPQNAFNKVLPRFAAHAPAFNNLRELVITHTGLETGAVINLDYTISTSSDLLPAFMGNETILKNDPVKEMEIIVSVPINKELFHKTFNIRTAPEQSLDKGKKVYKWIFRDIKARSPEGHQATERLPRVMFSTARDLKWVYFKFVNQPAFQYRIDAQMASVVDEIVKKEQDDLRVALKLQELVANDIKTYNIPPEVVGYRCRTPIDTWYSNGGTEMEKAVLLASLLLRANINAVPIAVIPDKFYDEHLGSLLNIEKFIVQVNPKKYGRWYLSSTKVDAQNLKYDLAGKKLLIVDGAIESLRTFRENEFTDEIILECKIDVKDTSKVTGSIDLTLSHHANPFFQFIQDSAKVKGKIKGITSSGITEFQFSRLSEVKSSATIKFEKSDPFKIHANYLFVSLPECRKGINEWNISYLPDKRETPFELPHLIHEKYEYLLNIPDNFELVTPFSNTEIKNNLGMVKITIDKAKDGILVTREIKLKEKVIPVEDYPVFKEMFDSWLNRQSKELVISDQ